MRFDRDKVPDGDRLRREARVAGLREFRTPSLEAVERRRKQLWLVTTIVIASVAAGVMVVTRPAGSSPQML